MLDEIYLLWHQVDQWGLVSLAVPIKSDGTYELKYLQIKCKYTFVHFAMMSHALSGYASMTLFVHFSP